MAILPGMRPRDSFLFEHTGQDFHDAVLRSASWIAVIILTFALVAAALLLARRNHHQTFRSMKSRETDLHTPSQTPIVAALTLLSMVILFLLTPLSAWVWTHAPQLAYLQFPWRFLTMGNPASPLSSSPSSRQTSASLLASRSPQPCSSPSLSPGSPTPTIANPATTRTPHPPVSPTTRPTRALTPTDEYTPTIADNDALQQDQPPAWLADDADGAPDPATLPSVVTTSDGNPAHLHFDIRPTAQQHTLIIRLRAFPDWHLQLDGASQPLVSNRDDGLVTLDLPANTPHTVDPPLPAGAPTSTLAPRSPSSPCLPWSRGSGPTPSSLPSDQPLQAIAARLRHATSRRIDQKQA